MLTRRLLVCRRCAAARARPAHDHGRTRRRGRDSHLERHEPSGRGRPAPGGGPRRIRRRRRSSSSRVTIRSIVPPRDHGRRLVSRTSTRDRVLEHRARLLPGDPGHRRPRPDRDLPGDGDLRPGRWRARRRGGGLGGGDNDAHRRARPRSCSGSAQPGMACYFDLGVVAYPTGTKLGTIAHRQHEDRDRGHVSASSSRARHLRRFRHLKCAPQARRLPVPRDRSPRIPGSRSTWPGRSSRRRRSGSRAEG